MSFEQIGIIGAGAWGTALAETSARAGRKVILLDHDPRRAAEIAATRTNQAFLPGIRLSDAIKITNDSEGLAQSDFILLAVPAQKSRQTLEALPAGLLDGKPVILCAKGLEHRTEKRQSEILAELAPRALPLVLSGPSFALDVAKGRPTAVTLAGPDAALTDALATALASRAFRPYASADIVGVELAGALKNIYALACGAVEGAGLGFSARAALIARAFAEMSRLVVRMGGEASTLTGLAGLGDLTLSCTTAQSRNYRFGIELGRGLKTDEIEALHNGLAEGVATTPVALGLAGRLKIDAPLVSAVDLLLSGDVHIDRIVAGLMTRPLKREERG